MHAHTPLAGAEGPPSEALGSSGGRPESGALTHPRGVDGSGRPAPSCHSRVAVGRARAEHTSLGPDCRR